MRPREKVGCCLYIFVTSIKFLITGTNWWTLSRWGSFIDVAMSSVLTSIRVWCSVDVRYCVSVSFFSFSWLVRELFFSVQYWLLVPDDNSFRRLSHSWVVMELSEDFNLDWRVYAVVIFLNVVVEYWCFPNTRFRVVIFRNVFLKPFANALRYFTVIRDVLSPDPHGV